MPEPEDVDARRRGDALQLGHAALRFDLGDHQGTRIQRGHFGLDVAARVIILRHAECRTAPAQRRVVRRFDDAARLLGALHHRHHHAGCTDVEGARDEVVFAARHSHQGLDADAAAAGREHLQRFETQARVLHVEQREFAGRRFQDLRHAGNEEFEHHRAKHRFAGQDALLDRARTHAGVFRHLLPSPWIDRDHSAPVALRLRSMAALFPIVDAHQHFWDPRVNYHPWLCDQPPIAFRYGDYSALRRPYLPADYFADAAPHQVTKTVYVETEWDPRDPLGEMRYVERLRRDTGFPTVAVAQAW